MTRRPKGPQPGKRRHSRRDVSMWAQVDGTLRHPVLNLSEGGLFLLTNAPMPIGQVVRLELPLGERVVRASGRVVHATVTEDWSGNGIELTGLAESDAAAIHEFLVASAAA